MPAIQYQRLSAQVRDLIAYYHQPDKFVRKLEDLFEFYADRTHRDGSDVIKPPIIPVYHIPPQVITEIIKNLRNKAQSAPLVLLNLCDALWEMNVFESKLIASKIISYIPTEYVETILLTTSNWLVECPDKRLRELLIEESLQSVRNQAPTLYLRVFSRFINSSNVNEVKAGLFALCVLVEEESFLDLPTLFQTLVPLFSNFPSDILMDMIQLLTLLSRKYPSETIHYIQKVYSLSPNHQAQTLIRSIIPFYSQKQQIILRNLINKN